MADRNDFMILCLNHTLVWTVLNMFLLQSTTAILIRFPSDTLILNGTGLSLPCSTSYASKQYVNWFHIPRGSISRREVFYHNSNIRPYYPRFKVSKDAAAGEYNLTISAVQEEDAGTYICVDKSGGGEERKAELTVLKSLPIGSSTIDVNTPLLLCGENKVNLTFSCDIRYAGNVLPQIHWRLFSAQGTIQDLQTVTKGSHPDTVTSDLILRADEADNGSVLVCLASSVNWTFPELKIYRAQNTTLSERVKKRKVFECKEIVEMPCDYEWHRAETQPEGQEEGQWKGQAEIVSSNRFLNLANVSYGQYYCTAECHRFTQPCIFRVHGVIFEPEEDTGYFKMAVILFLGFFFLVFLISGIVGLILQRKKMKRKRRLSAITKQRENLLLSDRRSNEKQ